MHDSPGMAVARGTDVAMEPAELSLQAMIPGGAVNSGPVPGQILATAPSLV